MRDIFIVDIQGFVDCENQFLPKEVAVVSLREGHIAHWVIAPPCEFSELPYPTQKQNNWLTVNFHGIEWYDGEISSIQLKKHIREIAQVADHIYVRGREKKLYLERITARRIFNLENISPTFEELRSSTQYCLHHGSIKRRVFKCALHNALNLKKWLHPYEKRLLDTLSNGLTFQDKLRVSPFINDTTSVESSDTVDSRQEELESYI